VRANDPLIYIGDRRSPPYIYRGGRFARRVGIGSDLASPAPGGTGASPAPGGTGPPASPAPGGTGWRTPITTPREGRQFRARNWRPSRGKPVRETPREGRHPHGSDSPHGYKGERTYPPYIYKGGSDAPLTGP
jgi:hypothetical protein